MRFLPVDPGDGARPNSPCRCDGVERLGLGSRGDSCILFFLDSVRDEPGGELFRDGASAIDAFLVGPEILPFLPEVSDGSSSSLSSSCSCVVEYWAGQILSLYILDKASHILRSLRLISIRALEVFRADIDTRFIRISKQPLLLRENDHGDLCARQNSQFVCFFEKSRLALDERLSLSQLTSNCMSG